MTLISSNNSLRKAEKNASIVLISMVMYFAFYAVCVAVGVSTDYNAVKPGSIDVITAISLVIFSIFLILSWKNPRYLAISTVFVLLAQPNAANNIFPSVLLGLQSERGVSTLPIFTVLDIFLILALVRYSSKIKIEAIANKSGITFLLLLMTLSFIVNSIHSKNSHDLLLLVSGSYQLRYMMFLFLLISTINFEPKYIVLGLVISILFLFVESAVFSYQRHLPFLASGSLAKNTFGNIIASVSIFLFYYLKYNKVNSFLKASIFVSILVGILTFLLTGTRMSLIAFILTYAIVYIIRRDLSIIKLIPVLCLILLIAIAAMYFELLPEIPPKYQVITLLEDIPITQIINDSADGVRRTPESSSLITRFELFGTSIRMISENIFFGIGQGRWNLYKYDYGYNNKVLIDSHNGYLAALSQYGLVALLFIYIIILNPIKIFIKNQKFHKTVKSNIFHTFGIITISMGIAEFSNAGLFKPQVFVFLAFLALLIQMNNDKK